jgi:hypothetical protein
MRFDIGLSLSGVKLCTRQSLWSLVVILHPIYPRQTPAASDATIAM